MLGMCNYLYATLFLCLSCVQANSAGIKLENLDNKYSAPFGQNTQEVPDKKPDKKIDLDTLQNSSDGEIKACEPSKGNHKKHTCNEDK